MKNRKKKWGVRDFTLDKREKAHLRKPLAERYDADVDSLEHLNLDSSQNLERCFSYGEQKGDRKRMKGGRIRIETYDNFPSPESINHYQKRLTRKKRRAKNNPDRKAYWLLFYPERDSETRVEKECRISKTKKKQPFLFNTTSNDTIEFEYEGDLVVASFYNCMFDHAIYLDVKNNHWAFVNGKLDFVSPSEEDLIFMLTI